jgi:hypothetical protein
MWMIKLWSYAALLSGLGLALSEPVCSQEVRAVTGYVRSAMDSSVLSGVHVTVVGFPSLVLSDNSGRVFFGNLPRTELRMAFERIGLHADTASIAADWTTFTVYLRSLPVYMDPVRAGPAPIARERFENLVQVSTVTLDPIEIAMAPTLAEPDLIRVVQLLPGTVAKHDYTVGFNVRGGESDQNLIQLDGVPVFNPSHLGGLFSTFDNSAVSRVDFLAGGFPANYGGRLSSVLDVQLKPGNETESEVHGSVSALSSKLLVEGPLAPSVSYMIGARRTYVDQLLAPFDQDLLPYYFADGLGKITAVLPTKGTLSLTAYWGRDVLDMSWVDDEEGREGVDLEIDWGNRLAGLVYRQPFGSMELVQHFSVSKFSTGIGLEPDILRLDNSAQVLTARTTLAMSRGRTHDINIGAQYESYSMDYNMHSTALETNAYTLEYHPRVFSAFLDDQWRPFKQLLVRPGVRLTSVSGGADFLAVEPRFGFKAFLTSNFALTGSAGRFHQAVHSIRDQSVPITMFDFWIGADDLTPVARSDHFVLGFEQWLASDLSLTVEGYTKSYDNLLIQNDWDDPKVRGDEFVLSWGDAFGVDVLLRKYEGIVTGWIAYGYAKANRHTADQSFPPPHDRRHTLDVVLQTRGPFGSNMGIRWGYGSALPYTGISGQWLHREYNAELHAFDWYEDEVVSSVINGERYPHYSRLDIGFRWEVEKWGATWRPYLQLVNAYNRQNVWVYSFDYNRAPPTRTGFSQLPILPTIGVEFEW